MENEMGTEHRTGMEKEAGKEMDQGRRFMRKNYAFFGGASALYALFYTFCLYRNASGITWPFFVAGTLVYFGLFM